MLQLIADERTPSYIVEIFRNERFPQAPIISQQMQAGEEALKMVKEQKQVTALQSLTKPIIKPLASQKIQASEEALKIVKERKQSTALQPLTKPIKPKKRVQRAKSVGASEAERLERERLNAEKVREIEQQKKLHEQEMENVLKNALGELQKSLLSLANTLQRK